MASITNCSQAATWRIKTQIGDFISLFGILVKPKCSLLKAVKFRRFSVSGAKRDESSENFNIVRSVMDFSDFLLYLVFPAAGSNKPLTIQVKIH